MQKYFNAFWKYKTFIIFIILTAIWSSLFSTVKYFFWWDLSSWIAPDLQVLSWYLSLWGVLAYLLGWALSYTFLKKYLLFSFSFLTLIFVLISYFFPISSNFWLSVIISSIWFFYWLWVILRSILTSIEIQKTWLDDAKVNGIIAIVFIVFLIIWTILWSKLFEVFWHNGFLFIIWLLIVSSIVSLFLDYDQVSLKSLFKNWFKSYKLDKTHKFKTALKQFIPELKYILKNYKWIIITSSFIWAISTVVSQKAVEYSVDAFHKLPSEAAYLLLYSSVGAILWNIISSFLTKIRWKSFFWLNVVLWLLIILFPFFNETFFQVWIVAFLVWLVFGASTNLIDSFYLNKIWKENKKEYGSSTYWLIFSIILFWVMFVASYIDKKYWFDILMYVLWAVILFINFFNMKSLLIFLARLVLKTRYKVKLENPEILKYDGPSLIFPNHVALVDPMIVYSFLYPYVKLSPLASRKYYDKAGFKQIMQLFDTIPIEDLQQWWDKEQIQKSLDDVIKWLKTNKHILIYPSGQIYRQGFEVIRWKQIAYNVCNLMPENTKVFWLRTRWLWGSMYSMSWDNGQTPLWKLFLLWILFIFANLFFFLPKRKVSIEIVDITDKVNTYKNMTLNEFNGFLENFYNNDLDWFRNDNEWWKIGKNQKINESFSPVYIPHYFYYNDVKDKKEPEIITWSLKDLENTKKLDLTEIDEKTKKTIFKKIANQKEISVDNVDENKNLILDLYFDSLDMAEIKSYIQANFPWASNPPITDLKTVWDLLIMAVGKSENVEKLKECKWWKWEKKGDLVEVLR